MIDAAGLHSALGDEGWVRVLLACGVEARYLKNKHGPCPACGGTDRFRFDNKGRGSHFCSQCKPGDGFALIMKINGCTFQDAFDRVLFAMGLDPTEERKKEWTKVTTAARTEPEIARPTHRIRSLLTESCSIEDCDAAVDYFYNRSLWPLPVGHTLRAHPSVEYWHDGNSVGRFPALVTAIRNIDGQLVTVHVTYLTARGEKLAEYEPRKILSALTGHTGCAARIMSSEPVMGIAEGIETALSAAKISNIPTWAALNTSLLAKFEPPPIVQALVIFADRDVAGLEAASKLMQRLQGKTRLEIRVPPSKDWNDVLCGPIPTSEEAAA